ncbi:MAG: dehydrogenase, partial [Bacteroidetes bacterium]|nr:dehydrogenase [Bacteroidota bacterium]
MYKQVDFNRVIEYDRRGLKEDALLDLYKAILKPRMIEEKMLSLLRQGKISKWFAGIGQEAIAVGSAEALEQDEYMLTMHRNLGVFTSRKVPLERLFAQFQGKKTGFTKGRDRSFHFGSNEHKIVGMISHLGPQLGVADGLALAHKLKKEQKVTLVFTGDGGTSEGDFHEALNVAAVWNLPVIFLIENNGYGLSTPNEEQFVAEHLIDKAIGYGMKGKRIDGNNLLEVYHTVKDLAGDMRKDPKPVILECMTFRMRGHEEASGTKYVPEKLMEEWAKKDPVLNYETFLKEEKHLDDKKIEDIRAEIKEEIENALKKVYAEDKIKADMSLELSDVYRPSNYGSPIEAIAEKGKKSKKKFINAITDALDMAMMKFQSMILMGQDIAEYGGVFKVTKGLVEKYGRDRVRNTPLCESAIIGTGLGLSIRGIKSVVEMQFADFVSSGFTQTVNNLAKIHYRWDQNADVVIRMPTGAGVSAGPFHSQSDEAWFYHTPGLKVVYPSNPEDAKGLLLAAIEDPNPVMYFEHKVMYRSITGEVPDDY